MNQRLYRKLFSLLLLVSVLVVSGTVLAGDSTKRLRIMTVVIVQQDDFLPALIAPYLNNHPLDIEYRSGHHREVVQAIQQGEVDLVMVHTKIKAMDKLIQQGLLKPGQPIFANPKAFLAPVGDPDGLSGLLNPLDALNRMQTAHRCFVINPHGALETLQRRFLQQADMDCVIESAQNTEQAIELADQKHGYTIWGLHPYQAKTNANLEPIVIPAPDLLQNIGIWVVAGTDMENEANDLADYLLSDPVRKLYMAFRLKDLPNVQAWWPPVDNSK